MAEGTRSAKAPLGFAILAGYLIVDCLWRLFTPGGPWPISPWHIVSMALDLAFVVCLFWMWTTLPEPAADSPLYLRKAGLLTGLGVAAGIVMLLVRFTSDHAWWTGHLRSGF